VLCYHSVSDAWEHPLAVTRAAFERQLTTLLRRGFRPLSPAELPSGGRRCLHVTFDDAYRDVLDVLPTIEKLGIRATFFAATAFADAGRPLDVPELRPEADAHPERLATMHWDDLRGLAERGHQIGSHTVTHPHLTTLGDAELDLELRDSRVRIQDELGRPCPVLSYPYGEHDRRVQAAVRRAGYDAAFALWAGTAVSNVFALPRVDVYRRDTPLRVRLKTSFVKPHVSKVLSGVRPRGQT
jgi:peptidoglycan/xylan/chitin deacetylase (PgdA/CDA1 family)